jgi:S-adenosylmethionine:tRNA ribosyltransferase-isomerase
MDTSIRKSDFFYELPQEFIAQHPLPQRDASKLLVYQSGEMQISTVRELMQELDPGSLLVSNNAKVIPARLFFKRITGAAVEVLLLEPHLPGNYEESFHQTSSVQWKCMIGNLKKWKDDEQLVSADESLGLKATLLDRQERIVELSWADQQEFGALLEQAGQLPIPPYLNRSTEESDYTDYQTVYAKKEGSVAAPTAGLHFTDQLVEDLQKKDIRFAELTLHVGAGTFLPVKDEHVLDHPMHREHFEVSRSSLQSFIDHPVRVAVGTTSLRVLESLYYCAVQLSLGMDGQLVKQFEPYEVDAVMSYTEAIQFLLDHMEREGIEQFQAATEIMILPEYRLKSVKALMTNFHLPESTLLMLISSVVGDHWKEIYAKAMENDFRFLSYGDSSLLFVE